MKQNKNLETFLKRGRKIVHDENCRKAMILWNNRDNGRAPKFRETMAIKESKRRRNDARAMAAISAKRFNEHDAELDLLDRQERPKRYSRPAISERATQRANNQDLSLDDL